MTRIMNARVAGVAFLAYIAVGITDMRLNARASAGTDIAGKLASMAQHAGDVRATVLLGMTEVFCALVLAVTLYSLTRDEDHDLATFGMICRVCEGMLGALSIPSKLALFWLAIATGADAPDRPAAYALAAYLRHGDVAFTGTFFAVGSLVFAWLLLRGRMIPTLLAWLGVVASMLLVVCLPLRLVSVLPNSLGPWIWIPMLLFEVPLTLWFLIKGVDGTRTKLRGADRSLAAMT
jgi:hypothetical protein